jgi:putative peptide zinc metalloprotease protein
VEQAEADLVATLTTAVVLRLADDIGRVIPGRISRQVPSAREEAPSKALVAPGGGRLAADPRDGEGRRTIERTFQIDVVLTEPLGRAPAFGQRVYLRFEHQPAPAATQAWHALRRLFLRHFDV